MALARRVESPGCEDYGLGAKSLDCKLWALGVLEPRTPSRD